MSLLDKYQSALLAVFPDVSGETLVRALDSDGPQFASFVIAHGLGPQWHERTKREEFRDSRLAAEALYLAQVHALKDVDTALQNAGIEYAVIKGAANRVVLYDNPAVRACHDIDLLVHPVVRVRAASALVDSGFVAEPEANSISRELLFSRGEVNVDLHWALLREGRLRVDPTEDMLGRRQKTGGIWVLSPEDTVFVSLVHPAFTKHLAGWDMGLHRVSDVAECLRTQDFDWQAVCARLEQSGVRTAAWATLRWVELLCGSHAIPKLQTMLSDVRPGRLRNTWLDLWLRKDLSTRTSNVHWARLFGFSVFLHDTAADSARAFVGRQRARRRSDADLAVFAELGDQ